MTTQTMEQTTEKKRKERQEKFVCMKHTSPTREAGYRAYCEKYGEIQREDYETLVQETVEYINDRLLSGAVLKLPFGLGYQFIRMRERKMDKKIVSFGMTQLKRKETGDPDAVVYVDTNIPTRRLVWSNFNCHFRNKRVSIFRPAKTLKLRIMEASLKGKHYIQINESTKANKHKPGDPAGQDGAGLRGNAP